MRHIYLEELCDINIGKTPSRSNPRYWNGSNKWLAISDMKSRNLNQTKECITDLAIQECNMKIVPKGTVLMSFKLSIGKLGITRDDIFTNEAIASFKIINEDILERNYLYYALQTINYKKVAEKAVKGSTLNKAKLKKIMIPLPSFQAQQKIADTLDLASEIIEKRKEQIAEMDKLIQSVFYEMFGDPVTNSKTWKKKKLSEMGIIARGKSKHRPRNAPELLGGNYPLIQTGDVANSGIFIKEYKSTYSELGLMQSKMWDRGTLCITIAANIAKTGILSFDACFPDSIVGMICNENTNEIFMQVWFSFFQQILEKNAPESAQKNINLQILGGLEVICPPIKMQNKFASIVEEIESQKKAMEESLDEMENNFNALMQKSFRGELFPEE